MKKLIAMFGCLFFMLGAVHAQKGQHAIGFGLNYGTEIESLGLGLKYQYNITNPIRIEPSFNYFFKNDGVSMFDLNVNVHYLFPIASRVKLYPLAGLTLANWMYDSGIKISGDDYHIKLDDYSDNECRLGVNLGAGAEFDLTRNWALNFEFRYQLVSDFDQVVFNFGAAYRF